MKSLHDSVREIQNTNWTFTNNFFVQIEFADNVVSKRCKLNDIDLNLYIKDSVFPQVGVSNVIEHFTLDRPRIAMGVWEPFQFNLNFYDFDNLGLYKKFISYVSLERFTYFDDYKFSVRLMKLGDHLGDKDEQTIAVVENCYITNVSQITFSNEFDAQILEFSIQIKGGTLKEIDGAVVTGSVEK